jgi:membrane carboxypeptidase/penicillin-binding protein
MIDMAVAYGSFANSGIRVDLNPILEIRDQEGQLLETNPCLSPDPSANPGFNRLHCHHHQALDPRVAYQITDILSDNAARSRAFGTASVLNIPGHQVAVKTGTTNSLRDNWTIGYTKDLLVATWVGNNDNTPMSRIASGITGASPIWAKITSHLLQNQPSHSFAPPANLTKVAVCTITGTLACNGCPSREEYFIPGTEPKNHCNSEQIAKILNPDPQTDPAHN